MFGAAGIAGDIVKESKSTFRMTNVGYNGSSFSPKLYAPSAITGRGWGGGSTARITTYGVSKVGMWGSLGASVITTGMAYRNIFSENPQPIDYLDATVGTTSLFSTFRALAGFGAIPGVGEAAFLYGVARLEMDMFSLGADYGPIGAIMGTNKWSGN